MIVSVYKPQGAYYGGAVAGPVFREIAEKVYAVYQKIDPEKEDMSEVDQLPEIKNGITREVIRVMKDLDIDYEYEGGKPSTYFTRVKKEGGSLRLAENPVDGECVPDVRGMGAKDAVFLLEKAGLQVRLSGIGKVKNQSLLPGYRFKKGQTILLILG